MKTRALPLILLVSLLSFSSCKKKVINPKEELPAATMEGKNTFGAMVNGNVWLPKGNPVPLPSNFNIRYDAESMGGWLDIVMYREGEKQEYLYIFMADLKHEGVYDLGSPEHGTGSFESGACYYDREGDVYREGKLEITKLDLENGIIAGTFEFTLAKPSCDTIRVTEGRFDKKLF